METLGSLLDKLCIMKQKQGHLFSESLAGNPARWPEEELTKGVDESVKALEEEIDAYFYNAIKGDMKLEEPKFKMYKNEKPAVLNFKKISEPIDKLFHANHTLWKLEDWRRAPGHTADEIKELSSKVSEHNRIRNDCMDDINRKFQEMINDRDKKGPSLDS
jgi:hypothetical protein